MGRGLHTYAERYLHPSDLRLLNSDFTVGISDIEIWTSDHRRSWHGPPPLFLTFCLQIYFQYNFFISLLFHLFFLILTCSCQYSYNLMLTSNCMCRPYINPYRVDTSCNNVAPVTNLCLGRATTRSHSSQWSKTKVPVET